MWRNEVVHARTLAISSLIRRLSAASGAHLISDRLLCRQHKGQGLTKGRSGATMIVQTPDSPRLVVVLTDSTKVNQIQGVLKARRKGMSMAALVPGLIVQAEGTLNVDNQLVASSVKLGVTILSRPRQYKVVCVKRRCGPKSIRKNWKSRMPL